MEIEGGLTMYQVEDPFGNPLIGLRGVVKCSTAMDALIANKGIAMITIERQWSHIGQVNQIQLADEQVKFAGTACGLSVRWQQDTHLHLLNMAVVVELRKLDVAYPAGWNFATVVFGLRAFALDKNQQGREG